MRFKHFGISLSMLACAFGLSLSPALSQGGQAIFQDERQMEMDNQRQLNNVQNQEQNYAETVQSTDAKNEPYRLYAEKRIAELIKLKAAGGSPSRSYANRTGDLHALETWLQADAKTRAAEQQHIKQLNQAIANLRESEQATHSNLGSDIQALRENQIAAQSDDEFNKMMKINQFNELQSEMGAASWGAPPRDGTYNSVGGYGFGGGYGYSPMQGRRW